MAEVLLRRLSGERFDVYSAGLRPTEIHPLTHEVLSELGLDTTALRAKGVKQFIGKVTVHYAIIVCEQTAAECPRIYSASRFATMLRRPGKVVLSGRKSHLRNSASSVNTR